MARKRLTYPLTCPECGPVVMHPAKHRAWHERNKTMDDGQRADDARQEELAEQAYVRFSAEPPIAQPQLVDKASTELPYEMASQPPYHDASGRARRPAQLVDKATGEILEGQLFTHGRLVGMLAALYAVKLAKLRSADQYAKDSKPFRDWLDKGGEELWDGEARLRAWMQPGGSTLNFDGITAAKRDPEAVIWAAAHGLLKLDIEAWKGMLGKAVEMETLKRYVWPGERPPRFQINKEE